MPRPRTVSDEAILDAVLALAHRVGPARVTFAAAAAETGLSAATLVQRFGTKRELLLAADKRGVDLWVSALDRSTAPSPVARVVEGLVLAGDPNRTPEQMANSVAMLQLDLADPDFHAETLRGARAVRARIAGDLGAALAAGELRPGTDVGALATLLETTYHGAMIGWAIHREGTLVDWMREQVEAVARRAPDRGLGQAILGGGGHRETARRPDRFKVRGGEDPAARLVRNEPPRPAVINAASSAWVRHWTRPSALGPPRPQAV